MAIRGRNFPVPTTEGTVALVIGLALAWVTISTDLLPSKMLGQVAVPLGIALVGSALFDLQLGWRNLFRVDLVCLVTLYYLTFAEFLYPQSGFNQVVTAKAAAQAAEMVLLGFAGLAVGRHLTVLKPASRKWLNFQNIPDESLFRLLLIAALLGYLWVLMSANFNPVEIIESYIAPRFSRPWSQGAMGGWSSLLTELELMRYAIPPLAAIIWNRRRFLPRWKVAITIVILGFVLFLGVASGTRTIFASYLIGFLVAYLLTLERPSIWKIGAPVALSGYAMFLATRHMLAFRNMGLKNYIKRGEYAEVAQQESLQIDFNLRAIAQLVQAMPERYDFLGWEVPFVFATKPVPRVLWPAKPEGLSVSIEQITGAEGWTVSTTYIGEVYMMGGTLAVIAFSLALGALATWWSRITFQQQTGYGVAVATVGFSVAATSMRSLVFTTTNMLPILALIVLAKFTPGLLGMRSRQL